MRGKRTSGMAGSVAKGITPADAGKTPTISNSYESQTDHPRGCGENSIIIFFYSLSYGSPPRMRGKHIVQRLSLPVVRITPADAGKTELARLGLEYY